ncbi:hypothetical protein niasHS_001781 [Heterodera schachtii]|uniref:Uncharacterized protein n=1 Tax=Heterodera schachtii TaxID=97005 RepID=A0ABD2K221_HETSC
MSTTWEISQNCPISCPECYHCFEPTEFTAPHLCLPPGVTPNSFRHYVSFREENAVMIFGAILLSGLALGWLICSCSSAFSLLFSSASTSYHETPS